MVDGKRVNGQFYTMENPFKHSAFLEWATQAGLPKSDVLEPFAGSNRLIMFLEDLDLVKRHHSFDIEPAHSSVKKKDTLKKFPKGFDVCITNPPWLAKNSASVRGLPFPNCEYDDLYKLALEKCLHECSWVASLVPESFIRSGLFRDRLVSFVSLHSSLFKDTGHPTGLAMFGPNESKNAIVWAGNRKVGSLSKLEAMRPAPNPDGVLVEFNVSDGNVGLIALDNVREASIRFCDPKELEDYQVKTTGRHITKLNIGGGGQ